MKPILHTINSAASDHGYHSYLEQIACPRRAALNRRAREAGETGLEKKSPLSIGIIAHSYLELHFKKAINHKTLGAVQFSDVMDEEARFEAERCVRAFIEQYPEPDIFGQVVEVEASIESGDEKVEEAVGVSPYSARLDLVTSMTKAQVKNLERRFTIEGPGKLRPGFWVVDHKLLGRKDSYLIERYSQSHQAASYYLAAKAKWSTLQGIIFNVIFKTKIPSFMLIVVPAPSERLVKSLHTLYEFACFMMEARPDQAVPTENNCLNFFGPCRWWLEGVCPRY